MGLLSQVHVSARLVGMLFPDDRSHNVMLHRVPLTDIAVEKTFEILLVNVTSAARVQSLKQIIGIVVVSIDLQECTVEDQMLFLHHTVLTAVEETKCFRVILEVDPDLLDQSVQKYFHASHRRFGNAGLLNCPRRWIHSLLIGKYLHMTARKVVYDGLEFARVHHLLLVRLLHLTSQEILQKDLLLINRHSNVDGSENFPEKFLSDHI